MARHYTAFGSILNFPDGMDVREFTGAGPMLSGVRGGQEPSPEMITMLHEAGFDARESLELKLASNAAPFAVEPVEMEVAIPPEQQAVVLIERDGVFSWRYPEREADAPALRSAGRVRFRLDPPPPASRAPSGTRNWVHDVIADWIGSAIRVYVLPFAARTAVEKAAHYLEGDVVEGLVKIASADPSTWQRGNIEPRGTPLRRILLLVHGTFSSTTGSFGALGSTPGSRAFLCAAIDSYDLVVGFDHRTLTEDPLTNARLLIQALATLDLAEDAEFDAIAFSRGGLVLRVLVEHLLRPAAPRVTALNPGRLVFVGCTNGGTSLAKPENWKRMLDLYTNLVLAGTRAAGWIPGFGTGAAIASETVKSISSFVQAIADAAVDETRVPGLAAMQPDSNVVRMLNEAPVDNGLLTCARYYWAGASFDARQSAAPGFADGLRQHLLDELADQIIKEANDLVVDCAMMSEFGRHLVMVKESRTLSSSEGLYHTIYFTSTELADCLGDWLLDRPDLFSRLEGDVRVIDAQARVVDVLAMLGSDPLAPVVITQQHSDMVFFHALTTEELHKRMGSDHQSSATLGDAIALEPSDANFVETDAKHLTYGVQRRLVANSHTYRPTRGPSDSRVVALVNGKIAGVITDFAWRRARKVQRNSLGVTRGSPATGLAGDLSRQADLPSASVATAPPLLADPDDTAPRSSFECQFEAEMPARPEVSKPAAIRLTVTREPSTFEDRSTHRAASVLVQEEQTIVLTARAIQNCAVFGPDEIRVAPPMPGKPQIVGFHVQGLSEGDAEVWIGAQQGDRKLVTIPLNPTFVSSSTMLTVQARSSMTEDEGALIDLRIRDVSVNDESNLRLEYELTSDQLAMSEIEESVRLSDSKRASFIEGIYKGIEKFWRDAAQSAETPEGRAHFMQKFQRELCMKGGSLCDQLIPEKIRRALWNAYDKQRVGTIRVLTREPSIPWEMLYLRDPDRMAPPDSGCFLAELGLLRWNGSHGYPPPHVKVDRSRAYSLIPEYLPPLTLPSTREDQALLKTLFHAKPLEASTERMYQLFNNEPFDLFHAGCHGEAVAGKPWESGLMLLERAADGRLECLRPFFLEGGMTHPNRPLVFLNACQVGRPDEGMSGAAGLGQAFLKDRKASILVAPMWSVHDQTASLFARGFYEKMAAGATLACAVRHARKTAKESGDPTWLAYAVWGHPFARIEVTDEYAGLPVRDTSEGRA